VATLFHERLAMASRAVPKHLKRLMLRIIKRGSKPLARRPTMINELQYQNA